MRDDIRDLTAEDYDNVIQEVTNHLSEYEVIKSIYQIGGVSAPGISDLDLLVVLDDNAKAFTRIWSAYLRKQTDISAYVFTHYPFLINEETVQSKGFHTIFPIFRCKHLYGAEYDLNIEPCRNSALSHFLDLGIGLWGREFNEIDRENMSLRAFLMRSHAIGHHYALLEKIVPGLNTSDSALLNDIDDMRTNHRGIAPDSVNSILNRIRDFVSEADKAAAEFIRDHYRLRLDDARVIYKNRSLLVSNCCSTKYQRDTHLLLNLLIYRCLFGRNDSRLKYQVYVRGICCRELLQNPLLTDLIGTIREKYRLVSKYNKWIENNMLGWGSISSLLPTPHFRYHSYDPRKFVRTVFENALIEKIAGLRSVLTRYRETAAILRILISDRPGFRRMFKTR